MREADLSRLCRKLADAMLSVRDEQGAQVFPTGGTRVLAYPAAHYAVADGSGDYGFIYFNVRMAKGRSAAVHKAVGETLAAAVREELAPLLAAAAGGPDAAGRRRPRGLRRQARQPASLVRQEDMSTTLDPQTIAALARELYDARKSRTQVAPLLEAASRA